MPNSQLVDHIRSEFARGTARADVIRSLLTAGWKVEEINAAIVVVDGGLHPQMPITPGMPQAPTQTGYSSAHPSSSGPNLLKTMIQNTAAGLFIICVSVLSAVSILGVWEFFSSDVITKSFETLGLLAFVAVLVIVASKFVGDPHAIDEAPVSHPGYHAIRNITLVTMIASSVLLALLGVLSIWDVISDTSTIHKSLSSLGIIAFASMIIVMVCLEREQHPFWKKRAREMTGGSVLAAILLIWLLLAFIGS